MLEIPEAELAAVTAHGERAYPEECCGFLIGRFDDGTDGNGASVVRVEPADNQREEERARRYTIAPEEVLHTMRAARAEGLDVVGYYHSHPDHPAEPSELDREHAWPGVSYLIVPVAAGRAGTARSWRLTDDRDGFTEEAVAVAEPAASAGTVPASRPANEEQQR